jgi:uncharacterized sulfatase
MWNLTGLCLDIALFLRVSVLIIALFIAGCFINEKIARLILRVFLSLILFLSLICVLFFITSGFLLDKVVFSYSFQEIWDIIQTSSKSPVWVYIFVVGTPLLFYFISGKRTKINSILLITFVILTLSSFFVFRELPFNTKQYHEKANKAYFFLKSTFSVFTNNNEAINDENFVKIVKEFRSYFPEHQFVEPEYPFLYKTESKDVLSSFFNLKTKPPNLVFIIIEGLSYEFFKNDYQLMPFLDSLSKKSLTWENCFSVSARTFGVLPALFGASPLGNEGFLYQCPNNPDYNSLLKILYQNNYSNHFFYGGNQNFDNMGHFANQNFLTCLNNDAWDQDIKNERVRQLYDDHLLYWQALRNLNKKNETQRVDVYLSCNTHDPFIYKYNIYYQNVVIDKVSRNNTLPAHEKKKIQNSIHLYGSFSYADWALQQLIEGYQKRDDFENTIFIITGDHHVNAKQFGGYYNYHVPLIIYSHMLKSSRNMKGVVTHRDITPTFLSLLQNNYNIETPKEVTWLNTALDTSLTFNANTFSPLQLIDHTIGGILYKDYLLCEGVLEEFVGGVLHKINKPGVLQQMNRLLSLYRYLDLYVFNNEALIKNDYAYKYTYANSIFSIEDSIAKGSYFAELEKLLVIEGPEKQNTTLFFDASHLYPINFLRFDVPDNIQEFRIDIEFKIYIKNENAENFYVVMDLSEISYKSQTLDTDKQNRWYTFKHTITYKKELWEHLDKKPLLKVYLWNPNKLEGYVDDIKVKIRGF